MKINFNKLIPNHQTAKTGTATMNDLARGMETLKLNQEAMDTFLAQDNSPNDLNKAEGIIELKDFEGTKKDFGYGESKLSGVFDTQGDLVYQYREPNSEATLTGARVLDGKGGAKNFRYEDGGIYEPMTQYHLIEHTAESLPAPSNIESGDLEAGWFTP